MRLTGTMYTDNGAPCAHCQGTGYRYFVRNHDIVETFCYGCHKSGRFTATPVDDVRELSAQHREPRTTQTRTR